MCCVVLGILMMIGLNVIRAPLSVIIGVAIGMAVMGMIEDWDFDKTHRR